MGYKHVAHYGGPALSKWPVGQLPETALRTPSEGVNAKSASSRCLISRLLSITPTMTISKLGFPDFKDRCTHRVGRLAPTRSAFGHAPRERPLMEVAGKEPAYDGSGSSSEVR